LTRRLLAFTPALDTHSRWLLSQGEVKIADFGWSVHAPSSKRMTLCGTHRRDVHVRCQLFSQAVLSLAVATGTMDYLPPEMIEKKEHDENVDIWCLGVLAYEFVCGYAPFDSTSQTDVRCARAQCVVCRP
jgi:serine/threonine protein kinase